MSLTSITKPGLYAGVPEDLYHAGLIGPEPGIRTYSRSELKALVGERTPAHFQHALTAPHPTKREFDHGSAAHQLVLGVGPELKEIKADNWRSPRLGVVADELRAAGFLPLLTKDYAKVHAIAAAVMANKEAARLLTSGRPEISAYTHLDDVDVWLRARADWLTDRELVDYKTARSASPTAFAKACFEYGYHLQDPMYTDVFQSAGHPAERFRFIVQESAEPYLVAVYELDADSVALGRQQYQEALGRLVYCLEHDEYPGYPEETVPLRLPSWAFPRGFLSTTGTDNGSPEDAFELLGDLERILTE